MTRKFFRYWLVPLLLGPTCALALEIGEIQVRSALNQLFDAEIPLPSLTPEELDRVSIKLAAPPMFNEFGLERTPVLANLVFSLQYNAEGHVYVKVVSTKPIREPSLGLLLEFKWPRGKTIREFTVLLDPVQRLAKRPSDRTKTVLNPPEKTEEPAADTPPVAVIPAAEPVEIAAERQPPSQPTPEPAPLPAKIYKPGDTYGPIAPGEGLWAIALKVRPDPGITYEQMMQALFRANPQAFSKAGINGLKTKATLRIPTLQEIADYSGSIVAKQLAEAEQPAATPAPVATEAPPPAVTPAPAETTTTAPPAVASSAEPAKPAAEPATPAPEPVVAAVPPAAPDASTQAVTEPVATTSPPVPETATAPEPATPAAEPVAAASPPTPETVTAPEPVTPAPEPVAAAAPPAAPDAPAQAVTAHSPRPLAGEGLEMMDAVSKTYLLTLALSSLAGGEEIERLPQPILEPAATASSPVPETVTAPELATPAVEPAATTSPAAPEILTAPESATPAPEPVVTTAPPTAPEAPAQPVTEPVATASPPASETVTAPEPATPVIEPAATVSPPSAPELLTPEAPAAPSEAPAALALYHGGNAYGPVAPNERLWDIAIKTQPDPSIGTDVMVRALFKANPQAFSKPNMDSLKVGATLRIPTLQEIIDYTGSPAAKRLQEQQAATASSPKADATTALHTAIAEPSATTPSSASAPAVPDAAATPAVAPASPSAIPAEPLATPPVADASTPSTTPATTLYRGGDSYGPVASNERLWDIAIKTQPDPSIGIDVMVRALFKANPQAFSKPNMDSLKVGATLRIPTLQEIVDYTGSPAAKRLLEQQPVTTPNPKTATPADATPPTH